ncbi:MAG: AAA family ATPase [Bacilli bacterium]|nr:AAA family ATPase [Bacilli bacterium]
MNLSKEEFREEENYLKDTVEVVRNKISELGQQLYDREEKVHEFQKFIWESQHDMDPTEMRSMMSDNDLEISMMMNKGKYFQKLFRIQNSPYFGAITFEEDSGCNKVYIGITHVEDEVNDKYLVHDWRAPICSMFYDYETGPASYIAPEGIIKGKITNKRQFKIENAKIKRVFDNNLNIDDELLQEVLATESSDKMKNIVNTIQQEQNAIIRNIEDKILIVQGIAGSGKTSVALHRIAFLLYKIENLNSKNILIFSPNQVFSEYISNVLPELGEDNTMQTTFHDFLKVQLPEFNQVESFTSFVARYYKYEEKNPMLVKYKQSDEIIKYIDKYVENLIKKIKFEQDYICHDFEITKEELNDLFHDRYNKLLPFDRVKHIAEYYSRKYYNCNKSKQKSIESNLYKLLNIKKDYKKIYKYFLQSAEFTEGYKGVITEKEITETVSHKLIKYEDACLLVYLKGMLEGFDYQGNIKEVVIDEAQDYSRLQYIIINKIFKRSGFTILGDINQTINPYYKYKSLNDLNEIFKDSIYLELTKTYRSSPEIIQHTNNILGLKHISAIRHNNNCPVIFKSQKSDLKEQLIEDIEGLQRNSKSIAVITKTDQESEYIYDLLKDDIAAINILSGNTKEFNKNLVVLPSYIAKGLEFDATIIYTKNDNQYTEDEKYLYYVACTRSQHQLIIYNNQ